jgi:hypothetical protein
MGELAGRLISRPLGSPAASHRPQARRIVVISKTLPGVKRATFAVTIKDPAKKGLPTPRGTGFFVSGAGAFVTAAHVVLDDSASPPSPIDASSIILGKEPETPMSDPGAAPGCHAATFLEVIPELDFALLRFDFEANRHREWLSGRDDFPSLVISTRQLEEGETVFSFGYPLSGSFIREHAEGEAKFIFGLIELSPRATSAIVSSTFDRTRMVYTSADPLIYVLDKALNYGNSGGPIAASSTGCAHAFCSRFQPVFVPQEHLHDQEGRRLHIMMPSLYGIVTSLSHPAILAALAHHAVPVSSE